MITSKDVTTCALTTNGNVRCWGHPTEVSLKNEKVKMVSANRSNVCILGVNGNMACHGHISDNTFTPTPANLPKLSTLSLGAFHACGITNENKVKCWGLNGEGQTTVPSDF